MTREEAIAIMQVYKEELEHRIAKIDYDVGAIDLYSIQVEAYDMAIEALSAEAAQGYTEWLEKIIVDAETFEWLCEDTNDKEWCEDNCHYSSIQAECLRHLYEADNGGADAEAVQGGIT